MIPFEHVPRTMLIHLLIKLVFYVKNFTWTKGASKTLCPLTIVEDIVLYFNFHFRVTHGEIFQANEGIDKTMSPRATFAIALGPRGNL